MLAVFLADFLTADPLGASGFLIPTSFLSHTRDAVHSSHSSHSAGALRYWGAGRAQSAHTSTLGTGRCGPYRVVPRTWVRAAGPYRVVPRTQVRAAGPYRVVPRTQVRAAGLYLVPGYGPQARTVWYLVPGYGPQACTAWYRVPGLVRAAGPTVWYLRT